MKEPLKYEYSNLLVVVLYHKLPEDPVSGVVDNKPIDPVTLVDCN
jgi:hypothetical protein